MDENKVKQIAQQVYAQQNTTKQFSVTQTSFHTHNGTDSPKVQADNIIPLTTAILPIYSIVSENNLIVNTFRGFTQLTLHAIAANGLGQKATINGLAQLGKCYIYNWQGSVKNIPTTGGTYEQFFQTSNAAYLDANNAANIRVAISGDSLFGGQTQGYFAYVTDNTGSVVASVQITSWTGTQVAFNVYLATNWYIKWYLTMS
jgi:hypothetical protein